MKIAILVMATFLQLMVCSAASADALGLGTVAAPQADLAGSQGVQAAPAAPAGDKLDVNVTVGEPMHSRGWYAQPIWIAVFIVGGIAVLALLALALRGSGTAGATIVK